MFSFEAKKHGDFLKLEKTAVKTKYENENQ